MEDCTNKFYCRTIEERDIQGLELFAKQEIVDEYLLNESIEDITNNNLITTGVFERGTENLVAFFSLKIEDFLYEFCEDDVEGLTPEEINLLKEEARNPENLKSRIKIAFLGVKHDKKKRGVGTYILEKASRIAKRVSTDDLYVEALYSAHTFYKDRGFVIIEEIDKNAQYSKNYSIMMRKEILPYQ